MRPRAQRVSQERRYRSGERAVSSSRGRGGTAGIRRVAAPQSCSALGEGRAEARGVCTLPSAMSITWRAAVMRKPSPPACKEEVMIRFGAAARERHNEAGTFAERRGRLVMRPGGHQTAPRYPPLRKPRTQTGVAPTVVRRGSTKGRRMCPWLCPVWRERRTQTFHGIRLPVEGLPLATFPMRRQQGEP